MKKKILMSIIAFSFLTNRLLAMEVKAPKVVPEANAEMYVAVDTTNEAFDYSKIKFTSKERDAGELNPDIIRRIFLDVSPNATGNTLNERLSENYFTAYCLDDSLRYPEFNTLSFSLDESLANASEIKMNTYVLAALYNNKNIYNAFIKAAVNYGATLTYTMYDPSNSNTQINDAQSALNILSQGKSVTIKLEKIDYNKDLTTIESVTAQKLRTIAGIEGEGTTYDFELKLSDILFSKYSSTKLEDGLSYDKALWIIEHSYPTLNLEETYENAGTTYENVLAELTILANAYNDEKSYDDAVSTMNSKITNKSNQEKTYLENVKETFETLKSCVNNTLDGSINKVNFTGEINELINSTNQVKNKPSSIPNKFAEDGSEINTTKCKTVMDFYVNLSNIDNYTYTTVQHAIWKVTTGKTHGVDINDKVVGSVELDKLFQYLIKDRNVENYSKLTFSNTLNLNKPTDKEIYKDNKDNYIYGPYSVTGDILSVDSILLSIVGDTKGASIVDKDGNEINEIGLEKNFYIKCNKSDKITNLKIKVATKNGKTFDPSTDRGRIYYANSPILQNVISGGKIIDKNIENEFELVYNPKTGVVNLAIIFMISIVAFTLGYLAINSKNQEINLD